MTPTADTADTAALTRRAPSRVTPLRASRRRGDLGLHVVRVLEHDPDLIARVAPEVQAHLARNAVARCAQLRPGAFPGNLPGCTEPGTLGLLVLDGLMGIEVGAGARSHLELLGEGDIVRPWVEVAQDATLTSTVTGHVFAPTRVAILDRHFAATTARWPEVTSALMNRLVLRSRRMSFQFAVAALPRVEDRLPVMLWHFADRWGRMTRDGVVLPLPLTHATLARVIAAHRPSVTSAIGRLRREGLVEQRPDRSWVLRGEPPTVLLELERRTGVTAR